MAGRRGNVRGGHFHLFSRKMEKSLSVCEKITNIRLGKFFEKSRNVSRFFAYVLGGGDEKSDFFRKNFGFLLSVCRKILNIRCGRVRHGELAVRDFFSFFFWEKGGFLLSVCRKNLNKGDDGLGAFIGGCQCRAPAGTGDFRKIFEIFSEIRGQNTTCLAITPIEGCFVGSGKTTFFKEKSEKP